MSAKFAYSLTDENPDLQKQIGCMNGIFQLFDRHRFLAAKRINGHHGHKTHPPGPNSNQAVLQTKSANQKATLQEKKPKKVVKEKRIISTESSRTSFSSSSCSSSFSSIDYNRTSQIEQSSQTSFAETPTRELSVNKPNPTKQSNRRSFDLCEVVKDSMHREVRGLSVKTAAKDTVVQTLKYIDSPRPSLPSKTVKPRLSGLSDSLRVCEEKDGRVLWVQKDIRRLSYDGKEARDTLKSTIKLKELPRLSLDSRERSMRGSTSETRANYLLKDLPQDKMHCNEMNSLQQEPGSSKRPSSIVAKLMGLEALPDSISTADDTSRLSNSCQTDKNDPFSRSSRMGNENKQDLLSGSSRNSHKVVTSPRWKNAEAVPKATSSQKLPIETAPWKHPHGNRGSPPPAFKCQEAPAKSPNLSPSVYGEMEKRLAELEFKTSAKDLRALKWILEAMQKTKVSDNRRDQTSNFATRMTNNCSLDHISKSEIQSNLPSNISTSPRAKASNSPKGCKSPIVIMKPASLVGKNTDPASTVNSVDNLFGLHKLLTSETAENGNNDVNNRTSKNMIPCKAQIANPINRQHASMDRSTNTRNSKFAQTSKMPRNNSEDKGASSGKISGNSSPRLQQKRFGLEKQSCLPNTSESSKARRQKCRQPIECTSPGRKCRPRSPNSQRSNDQLSDSNTARDLSHRNDYSSLQSESNASHIENEVTSVIQSAKTNDTYFKQDGQQKNLAARLAENRTMVELSKPISEQPSPVSVLDATFYRDDSPSPVKKTSNAFKDYETLYSDEVEWSTVDLAQESICRKSSLGAEIDNKILENISLLVQNPQQMNCTCTEPIMCHYELLCDSTNPDHMYIVDVMSASGLLRNLDSGLMIQFHPSDHLINPNLFLELEKIKATTQFSYNGHTSKRIPQPKPDHKIQRKLLFDVVNELLVRKLMVQDSFNQWISPDKRKPRGHQLLRELFSEVDRLQGNNSSSKLDNEDDSLGSIICEDMVHWSLNWTECDSEIPEVVLDIERLIFKDLITEVVSGERAGLQGRPGGYCRQLFTK
ncbi:hypothetical protein FNV43_RR14569 [Rhamnella rubrinervis]|uniref:DUF4378 domain-containing protein n=1 Tax=Rhamnella rubrinervis TaxID=2594499 RepID=A0A8K0MGD3_9ROSA|nr:hypothetical protein FNV43_RR14569 [Rhamnella rubrinervis]